MTWNYRVFVKDGQYAVHEVFYCGDGSINGFTAEPVFPRSEDFDGLVAEFDRYRRALSEPVLDYAELEVPGTTQAMESEVRRKCRGRSGAEG